MIKVYILASLILISLTTSAQDRKFDNGFFTELSTRINSLKQTGNNFDNITADNNVGFGLGSNFYYLANDRLKIRLTIGINFEKETLNYYSATTETKTTEVGFITSGLHMMIKSNKKIPLNIVVGLTPYYGLKDTKDKRDDLDFKKFDLTGDIELSYIIDLKAFKIMPELRFSKSVINKHTHKIFLPT